VTRITSYNNELLWSKNFSRNAMPIHLEDLSALLETEKSFNCFTY